MIHKIKAMYGEGRGSSIRAIAQDLRFFVKLKALKSRGKATERLCRMQRDQSQRMRVFNTSIVNEIQKDHIIAG